VPGAGLSTGAQEKKKPNIVFILTLPAAGRRANASGFVFGR
jgi:hypothetical protein